jgi:hypothetical protein
MLFSVMQTLCLWNINPRLWLSAYLQECARTGGEAPADLSKFLPWQMHEEKRKEWSRAREQEPEEPPLKSGRRWCF